MSYRTLTIYYNIISNSNDELISYKRIFLQVHITNPDAIKRVLLKHGRLCYTFPPSEMPY
jgi:hypothetical protein